MSYSRGVFTKKNGVWAETLPRVFDHTITTVPNVVVTITTIGGAGGNGGNDASNSGHSGYPGRKVTGNITIQPNDFLEINVGYGGASGGDAGSAPGAAGGGESGRNDLGFRGGNGGNSGPAGSSGAGGGGGAATVVLHNGNVIIVAGGGGGGGGSGINSVGRGQAGAGQNFGANWGGSGQNKTVGGEHGGGGGGCKIICTKLYEFGLMDKEIYEADQAFGAELVITHPDIYNGYRAWAEIVVDWMDGNGPNMMPWLSEERRRDITRRWSTSWAEDIATPWAEEMAYQMKRSLLPNNTGKAITLIGTPICKVVGVWQRVFGPSKNPAGFGKGLMLIPVFVLLKLVATVGKWLSK